jgi:2,3,4,5-tetrahydropyridine-2-carboxylate N-succinyltransferase
LQIEIERLYDEKPAVYSDAHFRLFTEFKVALNHGRARAAEPDAASPTGWRVNPWVKKGILLGFRMGGIVDMSIDAARQPFFDKSTYPVKYFTASSGVRIVPGGSSIRDGCYVGKGVTCMPPMFVNVGSYVGDGTMIDSHALVGSCAQVGRNCHISAASQIGGVLEPVGAMPVIVEDEVLVGGNCGVYEGVVVKRRAVLGTGTILNASTPVYDLVRNTVYRRRLPRRHQFARQGMGHLGLHAHHREIPRRPHRRQNSARRPAALTAFPPGESARAKRAMLNFPKVTGA